MQSMNETIKSQLEPGIYFPDSDFFLLFYDFILTPDS
jgi:hypothetical protein